MSIYQKFGVPRVINARSFSTRAGGSLMDPEVVEAMREAAQSFIRIEDLQEAAGSLIAQATGAEAGYVTAGASAALTLSMAACMAGLDPSKMNRLPSTEGMKDQVVMLRAHRNDYDHALRAAGAKIREVGFNYATFPYELEEAIDDRTAATFYLAGSHPGGLSLETFARISHRKGIPVIVDASAQLPPRENLRAFIREGADLVAFSGGKHVRGPQATGILCGRADLILSVALQQQDMDVFPRTWTYRHLITGGSLTGPPHHGIGRSMKVGKEEIVGLMVALQRYLVRDLEAEQREWQDRVQRIVEGLRPIEGLEAKAVPPPAGRPVPTAQIRVDPQVFGMSAEDLVNALQAEEPLVIVNENEAHKGKVVFLPESLQPGDVELIVHKITQIRASVSRS